MQRHDVVVIGAGLAGLACATHLTRAGVDVVVLEASDAVGGRVRTDMVDQMLLDRGFQLLNPAYPALAGVVDLDALSLCSFEAGVVIAYEQGRTVLADPRRSFADLAASCDRATGTVRSKLRLARYVARTLPHGGRRIADRPDVPYGRALAEAGVEGYLSQRVLFPFLAGVLGEDRQESSRVFVDLLLRTFARGIPALPTGGMQSLPNQLARGLPAGAVATGQRVVRVRPGRVRTADAELAASCVVIAADPETGTQLAGLPTPQMRALTTFYHRAAISPTSRKLLHIDGDRRGPVVNSAVVSDVSPQYCVSGALIATTVLGSHTDAATANAVQAQLALIYGVDTSRWELVATYAIPHALPAMLSPLMPRQSVACGDGVYIAGDHRDTASIQGALVSGHRTAVAVLGQLGIASPPLDNGWSGLTMNDQG